MSCKQPVKKIELLEDNEELFRRLTSICYDFQEKRIKSSAFINKLGISNDLKRFTSVKKMLGNNAFDGLIEYGVSDIRSVDGNVYHTPDEENNNYAHADSIPNGKINNENDKSFSKGNARKLASIAKIVHNPKNHSN